MVFDNLNIPVQLIQSELFVQKKVSLSVLRLDEIDPIISGNKIFKLQYFLKEAIKNHNTGIITFGGAFSNHLAATAKACKLIGLPCVGIVRGEAPTSFSHTLQFCEQQGMQLQFIARDAYSKKDENFFVAQLGKTFANYLVVPEGGYGNLGAKGATLIHQFIPPNTYTHICVAVGTGTTAAGIIAGISTEKIICIPVLKGMHDIDKRIADCIGKYSPPLIFNNYHFGGYAKKTPQLIEFMNQLWQQHNLPTDFVYTAKMMFAIFDKITNNFFETGSNILCLHTGGLQGNLSLPKGELQF
jgi:1-aminocyclopropane-1-carboxylate deaminase